MDLRELMRGYQALRLAIRYPEVTVNQTLAATGLAQGNWCIRKRRKSASAPTETD